MMFYSLHWVFFQSTAQQRQGLSWRHLLCYYRRIALFNHPMPWSHPVPCMP